MKQFLLNWYSAGRDVAKRTLLPVFRPRRLDICCCGLSKTGTHSIAGIFQNYRNGHHPDAQLRVALASAVLKGETDGETATRILRRRDRVLWLEVESSSFAGTLIEPLARACPAKRFILTMRDVYSWFDSWIDHNINSDQSRWAAIDLIRLRASEFRPTKFDSPLTSRGIPPLACHFQLWANHNARVLEVLPPSRLLLLKTHEITARMPELAMWAGVPVETLRADRNWLFAAPTKHNVLKTLDRAYVQETADRYCGAQMRTYFPDTTWT